MKKRILFLFVTCLVALGFSSCSNDNNQWRDDNLAFMDKIKNREGILEIKPNNVPTGMYYEVLKAGTGVTPIHGNKVKVAYKVWLYNDTINYTPNHPLKATQAFDSSDNYEMTVGGDVIDGWNLALQQMPVGSKWRLYIPYYLAYGTMATSAVPAYSSLIFDIELKEFLSEN